MPMLLAASLLIVRPWGGKEEGGEKGGGGRESADVSPNSASMIRGERSEIDKEVGKRKKKS